MSSFTNQQDPFPDGLSSTTLRTLFIRNKLNLKLNPKLNWSFKLDLTSLLNTSCPPPIPCCKPHLHESTQPIQCNGTCSNAIELRQQLNDLQSSLNELRHTRTREPSQPPPQPPCKRRRSSSTYHTTDFVSAKSLPFHESFKDKPAYLDTSSDSLNSDNESAINPGSTMKAPTYYFASPVHSNINNSTSAKKTGKAPNLNEGLKGIDPKIIEAIENEILDKQSSISWDDIAGLEDAKQAIQEIVVWPMKRPDLFGAGSLRRPTKGVLLFGPPGTGKTLIAKCIASQVEATFFSISASSLTSKWVGEGEKLVRALFAVARAKQPSVVFIDEIDSLLTSRSEGENDASRRIKTEFLIQFDGASTSADERLLVIGATNRPQELDEAARRRFKKRLLIPLPCGKGRLQLLTTLLRKQAHELTPTDLDLIVNKTVGYSGSDLTGVCEDAAMAPVREVMKHAAMTNSHMDLRPVRLKDVLAALHGVRASVSLKDMQVHEQWNLEFGSTVGEPPRLKDY